MQTFNESLVIALDESWENYRKKKDIGDKGRVKRHSKDGKSSKADEVERAKTFKNFFGNDNFRLNQKGKEWYVKFSVHAMSRYIERDAKLDKKYLDDLLIKMIKVLQHKEKGKLFLVYSVSLKRAMVVTKKTDDSFNVVTVYPEGENVQSKNTQKVLIERFFGNIIDEYIEIE